MTTTRLWIIAGIAAVIAAVIGIAAAVAAPTPEAVPSATPSAVTPVRPEPTPESTPTAKPSPSRTASAFEPSCGNTATQAFLDQMQAQGHAPLDLSTDPAGPRPFDTFLDGTPEITVVCRWGAAPEIQDLAWTIIPTEAIAEFVQRHVDAGAVLTPTPEGNVLEIAGGGAYLFTETDSRWSTSRASLAHIKAPHDER